MTAGESKFRAVIFDLGGVVFPSPFDAFDVYDAQNGLTVGTTRALIRTSSETGAWAALERNEITIAEFATELQTEAEGEGFVLDAHVLLQTISGGFGARPEMLAAIRSIRAHGLATAALTNNWAAPDGENDGNGNGERANGRFGALDFDVVVESSIEGLRKPDPRIYHLVLDRLAVRADETVFLDDLGINLKPARALGMTTIKVVDPPNALRELEAVLGFPLA
jgi:putative hydrolase of the HAD superfamily